MDLPLALEEAFDVEFRDKEAADKIRTVREAVESVENRAHTRRSA
jgi:acyl carrier protein